MALLAADLIYATVMEPALPIASLGRSLDCRNQEMHRHTASCIVELSDIEKSLRTVTYLI